MGGLQRVKWMVITVCLPLAAPAGGFSIGQGNEGGRHSCIHTGRQYLPSISICSFNSVTVASS